MKAIEGGERGTKRLRWLARVGGSSVAALWLLMGIGSAIVEDAPWRLESVIVGVLIVASVLGILIAWWREAAGGAVVLICGMAHSLFAFVSARHSKLFAVSISGGPLLVIGCLFLAAWWRSTDRSA